MINCTHHQWFWLLAKEKEILKQRQKTKTETMYQRRKIYRSCLINNLMGDLN